MTKTRVGLVSLGCPKNLVDSEEMLGALVDTGQAQLVDDRERADVVIVNTCAFIESARRESVEAILEAVARKERGEVGRVVVAGCLAQRYGDALATELPEVDAFVGVQSALQIADAVFPRGRQLAPKALPMAANQVAPLSERYPLIPASRVRASAPWSAYLKVSEGCDHGCTFCSIPLFRGRHRSKPLERVVDEARRLVDAGACEINLIAQDTTAYGMDLYKELALPRLLEALERIEGLRWVRLLYCYPTMLTDRLIRTMAHTANVVPYVDIPLQHGDDAMLSRMKRGGSAASYLRLLDRLRAAMPAMAIRTTFLVGFPGEDEAAFERLMRFVEEARFDRVGAFVYSPEEGTPGAAMTPRVPRRIARERRNRLMARQQEISLSLQERLVGTIMPVLVEGRRSDGAIARSWRDAPEVDGVVRLPHSDAAPGTWRQVRVVAAEPYDLVAQDI